MTSKILNELREQAYAYLSHCTYYKLHDRLAFQDWMVTNLSKEQLVSLIDGEVTRQAIFEVYLNDKY